MAFASQISEPTSSRRLSSLDGAPLRCSSEDAQRASSGSGGNRRLLAVSAEAMLDSSSATAGMPGAAVPACCRRGKERDRQEGVVACETWLSPLMRRPAAPPRSGWQSPNCAFLSKSSEVRPMPQGLKGLAELPPQLRLRSPPGCEQLPPLPSSQDGIPVSLAGNSPALLADEPPPSQASSAEAARKPPLPAPRALWQRRDGTCPGRRFE